MRACQLEKTIERELPTERQAAILEYLRVFRREHKRAPTIRQVVDHLGYKSPNAVSQHYTSLEKKGWLTRVRKTNGSVQVAKGLAVLGEVG